MLQSVNRDRILLRLWVFVKRRLDKAVVSYYNCRLMDNCGDCMLRLSIALFL